MYCIVMLMNQYYLHLAHALSEWENHRTQEQFERHVVMKLVLFEFVNTFLALFYIAFYLQVAIYHYYIYYNKFINLHMLFYTRMYNLLYLLFITF